jgi:hypothetical protein
LRKIVDDVTLVSCASGPGIIRTEVWEDETGYDNAHGTHHRHFYGKVELVSVTTYEEATRRFYADVRELRKRKR